MSRPTRVALLTNFLPPYRIPLLDALRARVGALRVLLSTPMERNRGWTPEWGDLDVVVQHGLSVNRRWNAPQFTEEIELHIPVDTIPLLWAYRPDVIITGEMGARTAQAMVFGRATNTPVYIWATLVEHLEVGRDVARRQLRRWLLARAAGVIVNGGSGASYIRRFRVPDARIAQIPQTTEVDRFATLPLVRRGADERRILVAGRLSAGKGLDRFLHAAACVAARLPQRTIDICIVGDGPEKARLQTIPLPGNVNVEWTGHVSYDALPHCYARAGILAFPTLGDEWGLVVNEALAAGVPVLGSRYSQAVDELIQDGVNGWTFVPEDAAVIANALERALNTTADALMRMRSAARASVAELTPDKIADCFVRALHVSK